MRTWGEEVKNPTLLSTLIYELPFLANPKRGNGQA